MIRRCRPLLGTFVEIECDHAGSIDCGFAAIERVHQLMSAHESDSELTRINRFAHLRPVRVSTETFEVLERALHWSRLSAGAFDAVRAGKAALESGLIPRHADQPLPLGSHWTWLEVHGASVRLLKPACLDLGGIAKGYAVDLAVKAMKQAGATRGLVNAGGDLRAFGEEAWPATIVEPKSRGAAAQVELRDVALATSAVLTDAHPGWVSVTVRAPNACDADALTKIVWALGHRSADLLVDADAEAFAIRIDGSLEAVGDRALAA